MSRCEELAANASAGVAPALRAVDCLSNEATASAFGRLFGGGGALLPALTILLTLYIAFFAISLLTGRSRIGISALTPRMMTLGLVLTFATSWVAYQGVVWNLAVGAPDQIAGVLTGTGGSATQIFGDKIDILFASIAEVSQSADASQAGAGAQAGAAAAASSGTFTPNNLIWFAAVLLMLGTVGVLVTARIALAVLLTLGPIFVVLALFAGTRGLFAGWLRGVVLTSVAPLFAVLGGSFMLELAVPVVVQLRGAEGVDGRAAMALFLVASVHVALMVMVMKVAGTMVNGWSVFGLANDERERAPAGAAAAPVQGASGSDANLSTGRAQSAAANGRSLGGTIAAASYAPATAVSSAAAPASDRRLVHPQVHSDAGYAPTPARHRPRGVGSRFRPTSAIPREMFR